MQWKDEELGLLIVRVNVRAKRLVFRTKNDAVYISVPPGTTAAEVKQAVEKLRPRLLANRRQLARPLIDLDYRIEAPHFQLSVVLGEGRSFYANSKVGSTQLVCPQDTDFSDGGRVFAASCKGVSSGQTGGFVPSDRFGLCRSENQLQ